MKNEEATEIRRVIARDGVKLVLVAKKLWEGEWELTILNELGVASVWMELFDTHREAMQAGKDAIDTEGVEPFVEVEGFDYLLEERRS